MSGADVVDLLLSTIGVGVLLAPLVLLTVGGAVGLIDATRVGDRPSSLANALRLSVAAAAWVWAGPMVARGGWWAPEGAMSAVGSLALLVFLAAAVLTAAVRATAFLLELWEEHRDRSGPTPWDHDDSLPPAEELTAREEWLLSCILSAQEDLDLLEEGPIGPLGGVKRNLIERRLRRDRRELEQLREESTWLVP